LDAEVKDCELPRTGKFVPLSAMKAYMGCGSICRLIIKLCHCLGVSG